MTTVSTGAHRHCQSYIKANLQDVAHEQFPDNTHNAWTVVGFEATDELTLAEATPDPDDVGYPSFKFAFYYDAPNDTVKCVAVYCFEDGEYTLLCTDRKWSKRAPKKV